MAKTPKFEAHGYHNDDLGIVHIQRPPCLNMAVYLRDAVIQDQSCVPALSPQLQSLSITDFVSPTQPLLAVQVELLFQQYVIDPALTTLACR